MNQRNIIPFSSRRHLGRILDEVFTPRCRGALEPTNPPLVVREEPGAFVVQAELPGTRRDDIDVELAGRVLTISGSLAHIDADGFHTESFKRQIHLGDDIDRGRITACCRDGLLTVRLPKRPIEPPRKIPIREE